MEGRDRGKEYFEKVKPQLETLFPGFTRWLERAVLENALTPKKGVLWCYGDLSTHVLKILFAEGFCVQNKFALNASGDWNGVFLGYIISW